MRFVCFLKYSIHPFSKNPGYSFEGDSRPIDQGNRKVNLDFWKSTESAPIVAKMASATFSTIREILIFLKDLKKLSEKAVTSLPEPAAYTVDYSFLSSISWQNYHKSCNLQLQLLCQMRCLAPSPVLWTETFLVGADQQWFSSVQKGQNQVKVTKACLRKWL